MKNTFYTFLFLFSTTILGAQVSLEQQVSDTACVCLSAIDTSKISSKSNGYKMGCLQQAMLKNNETIIKHYTTEKRKEEDLEKMGIKGSLMIKVQNILSEQCKAYQIFERKVQARRVP